MSERWKISGWLDNVERTAVDVISVFAPWLGPIPSAYLVGDACINNLQWHIVVAVIAALSVESIGVVSVVTSLRAYEWNATKNKTDPAAPFLLSLFLVIFYLVVTVGLVVLLNVIPALATWAPAVFPLLAVVGAVNIAIKNGQQRRELAKADKKQGRKRQPKVKLPPTPARKERQEERQLAGNLPSDWRKLSDNDRYEFAHATREERDRMMPEVAERTRRLWHERGDEIAAQNGSFSGGKK